MTEVVDIKIGLNVDRVNAEELYDEIEGLLALCFENVIEQHKGNGGYQFDQRLSKIITPTALSGYLIDKIGNDKIKVEEVSIYRDPKDLTIHAIVRIQVPNLWAIQFGKDFDERLDDTVEFFKNWPKDAVKESTPFDDITIANAITTGIVSRAAGISMMNGVPVNPLIGSVYYDQLSNSMKLWDGNNWNAL